MALGRNSALYINRYAGSSRRPARVAGLPLFLCVVGVLMLGVIFFLMRPTMSGRITDEYTGEPVANVTITFGNQQVTTDSNGRYSLTKQQQSIMLHIEASPQYTPFSREIHPGNSQLDFSIRPATLSGTLHRKGTGAPIAGLSVRAVNGEGISSSQATSDQGGHYYITGVPENARLIIEGAGVARREFAIERTAVLDLELRADTVTGVVRDQRGKPISGALIGVTGKVTASGPDGAYTLAGVPETGQIVARAANYRSSALDLGEMETIDFTLAPLVVKAIYVTPDVLRDDARFNALVQLTQRTEINAMVLDVKDEDGRLHHNSQVPFAQAIKAIYPLGYNIQARVQYLHAHGIYAIGRMVCMLDPTLATARPDLAVRNSKTGGVWKNAHGLGWANATKPEVWQYLTDLAVEATSLGFDEVQLDYVRFPTDGDMDALDYGEADNSATRSDAIASFLSRVHTALAERGVALAADIFGIVLWDESDNGIGQKLEKLVAHLDYICPMIYPSHFASGAMGFEIPNDHPYEVILLSLQNGALRSPDARVKFRPWLQDFSYGVGIDYGPNEVRGQIQATYDFGGTSWMLWNARNVYTEKALLPK